ncbi:hypothetical protein ACLMAJ_04580 [Nocardia sp. KC 131]
MSQTSADKPSGSTFAWSEDWLATIVGLVLVALVLVGVIPDWLVP